MPGFEELEAARIDADMTVTRFCEQLGIPRSSWYRWRQTGTASKGPWPTPAQDACEIDAKVLAADWDGCGHRKLAELKRVGIEGVDLGPVSDSAMYRVLDRNGLSSPANYTGEVRKLAGLRKETFISPPERRNRLWQADFSEHETSAADTWNLGGVVDYWAKVNLACEVTIRKTTKDAIGFSEAATSYVAKPLATPVGRGEQTEPRSHFSSGLTNVPGLSGTSPPGNASGAG